MKAQVDTRDEATGVWRLTVESIDAPVYATFTPSAHAIDSVATVVDADGVPHPELAGLCQMAAVTWLNEQKRLRAEAAHAARAAELLATARRVWP